jgi:hypothetical protein
MADARQMKLLKSPSFQHLVDLIKRVDREEKKRKKKEKIKEKIEIKKIDKLSKIYLSSSPFLPNRKMGKKKKDEEKEMLREKLKSRVYIGKKKKEQQNDLLVNIYRDRILRSSSMKGRGEGDDYGGEGKQTERSIINNGGDDSINSTFNVNNEEINEVLQTIENKKTKLVNENSVKKNGTKKGDGVISERLKDRPLTVIKNKNVLIYRKK